MIISISTATIAGAAWLGTRIYKRGDRRQFLKALQEKKKVVASIASENSNAASRIEALAKNIRDQYTRMTNDEKDQTSGEWEREVNTLRAKSRALSANWQQFDTLAKSAQDGGHLKPREIKAIHELDSSIKEYVSHVENLSPIHEGLSQRIAELRSKIENVC